MALDGSLFANYSGSLRQVFGNIRLPKPLARIGEDIHLLKK
jgi:hypothetical protein